MTSSSLLCLYYGHSLLWWTSQFGHIRWMKSRRSLSILIRLSFICSITLNVILSLQVRLPNISGRSVTLEPRWKPIAAVQSLPTKLREYALSARLTHLVVVFGKSEINELQQLFYSWVRHPPCVYRRDDGASILGPYGFNVRLLLHVADLKDFRETRKVVEKMYSALPNEVKMCFNGLSVTCSELNNGVYEQPHARNLLFVHVMLGFLGAKHPSYIYYMNVKSRPVVAGWLGKLDSLCRWPNPPFLIKSALMPPKEAKLTWYLNEEALYYMGSPTLRVLYWDHVYPIVKKGSIAVTFEERLFLFLFDWHHLHLTQPLAHLFQVTDAVAFAEDEKLTVKAMRRRFPNAVIVRGRY